MRFLLSLLLVASQITAAQDCTELAQIDTSAAAVLGDGTPGSVTTAHIQSALNVGGHIRFNQGLSASTIDITSELVVSRDTVIDGQGLITFDGMNSNRLLLIDNPANLSYTVTVQNINFSNANIGSSSGAAIFKPSGGPWQAVNLQVNNVVFNNNHAIQVDQDGGGGGIYAVGMNDVFVSNSQFTNNSGSNGGAFYSLGSKNIRITDSEFSGNQATGNNGNPGNGGNAGAIGIDGAERGFSLCRSDVTDNSANAYGTGFFSVMYDQISITAFTETFFGNNINPGSLGLGGGAYVQGGPFVIEKSSFVGNQSPGAGGLFLGPNANGSIVNSTFHGNVATETLGGGLSISESAVVELRHLTIANNQAPCPVCFAGGLFVASSNLVTMGNTILSHNTGGNEFNPWNILNPVGDEGGNLQYPQQRPNGQAEVGATGTVLWGDPLLAAIADNGGYAPTMAIDSGSPAYNAANNGFSTPSDQRGVSRYLGPDIGAYEYSVDLIFENGFEL